jgi:hypothetical protein
MFGSTVSGWRFQMAKMEDGYYWFRKSTDQGGNRVVGDWEPVRVFYDSGVQYVFGLHWLRKKLDDLPAPDNEFWPMVPPTKYYPISQVQHLAMGIGYVSACVSPTFLFAFLGHLADLARAAGIGEDALATAFAPLRVPASGSQWEDHLMDEVEPTGEKDGGDTTVRNAPAASA